MDMVERVARAIWGNGALGGTPWDMAPPEHRHVAIEEARRAIAAMREPTEAMIRAADNLHPGSGLPYEPGSPADVWRAMIDAAEGR